jgi:hypothetical protein
LRNERAASNPPKPAPMITTRGRRTGPLGNSMDAG